MELDALALSISSYEADPAGYAGIYEAVPVRPVLWKLAEEYGPGAVAVDLGCGSGRDAAAFGVAGLRAVGLDVSPGMLTWARAHHPGPSYVRADARALPLADGGAAIVWSSASLVHLSRPQVQEVLAECARVLRPGGALFVSVPCGGESHFGPNPSGRRWMHAFAPADLAALLDGAGFTRRAAHERAVSETLRVLEVVAVRDVTAAAGTARGRP